MLRMFRLRRYRVFVIFALLVIILLVKFTRTIRGDGYLGLDLSAPPKNNSPALKTTVPVAPKDKAQESREPTFVQILSSTSSKYIAATSSLSFVALSGSKSSTTIVPTIPPIGIPDRTITPDKVIAEDEIGVDDIHAIGPPGRQELLNPLSAPTAIHWQKQTEHFPVPTESIIQLPTGVAGSIPKIQYKFNDETPDAKINREKRQVRVKNEFKKAWSGYRKHAWMHDELSPKSGSFRDPFCGWAATLVDSLDTLWIMGLLEEFEEAANAVEQIDFTTSFRSDIPVFETTIRYLGGLLAAYDVSEGKYKILLDKAAELGEILMGAFDTPNRMPVLSYRWNPAFASQPHRASQRSNLAELGSLSMEFTRLAQLTKDPRYYDAVARVTDALSEYQDRGTKLGSVFPEYVDASGCNRTVPHKVQEPIVDIGPEALHPSNTEEEPEGYKPNMPSNVKEPRPNKKPVKGEKNILEMEIVPGELSKAHIIGWDENRNGNNVGNLKRELLLPQHTIPNRTTSPPPADSITGLPTDLNGAKTQIGDTVGEWDCAPQGLDTSSPFGYDKFSMGGGQDSTYEYFPKQYLLLGGREEKYKKLYLKTIEDVRKWMLYRPMLPDNRDILFSGAVTTGGQPEKDLTLQAEVEHLTCFIGGMIGMASKIFTLEGDLELAKKLAEGCVWAYESTPSGIMPEGATVMPCESAEHCRWNQTAYYNLLDPMADERDNLVKEYDANKINLAAEAEAEAQAKLAAEEVTQAALTDVDAGANTLANPKERGEGIDRDPGNELTKDDQETRSSIINDPQLAGEPVKLEKRQKSSADESGAPTPQKFMDGKVELEGQKAYGEPKSLSGETTYDQKSIATESELQNIASGRQAEFPPVDIVATPTMNDDSFVDPQRPLSHQEYVDSRIKLAGLPAGYVGIRGRKYILRPEAIESVWYMYRITGDETWQDKGWKMFESIINATSTTYGHSAVDDVTVQRNETTQSDEMESFWLAETLKYFYLLYSTPDTISLDEWVLNTEAHPFKRGT